MIDQTIGHWEKCFAEQLPGWYSAPRELTRRLFIYARYSRLDSIVASGQPLSPADLSGLLKASIGPECAELLKREIDQFELSNGLHYVETYAEAAGVRSPSPLYPYAIAGALCRAKLLRQLCEAGETIQTGWEDGDAIKVLRRNNKLNTTLQELLTDRDLRKRIKKVA